jgi:purine nucleosidase
MTRIILDTDLGMGQPGSGIDDGFALALALAEPELPVELVTTVNGNTDVDNATRLTDLLGTGDPPAANCSIAAGVDAGAFRSYFFDRIGGLP